MLSTPPFQGTGFLECFQALLPRQFPAGAAAPALISEHPLGLQHPLGTGVWREGPTLLRHPSVHPSLCPKARGFGACRAARGGGQCWEPPPSPRRVPSPSRYSGVSGDRCWRGLSFPLGRRLCNARVHGRFSLARGPSLPGPTPAPGPGTAGGRGSGGRGGGFALAPRGTGGFRLDPCPQKPSGESNGLLLFMK